MGRLKYNQQLLKQTLSEIEEVKLMFHTILFFLKGSFIFEQSLIERFVCEDEIDCAILHMLIRLGTTLTSEIENDGKQFKIESYIFIKNNRGIDYA